MKANLNHLSHRAQSFIKTPKFFKKGASPDFLVTIDDQDRILTVSHGKNPDDIEFILAEVVAKFSENKKISEIWKINFREIESFLRDENHLPAFTGETQEIESLLIQIKVSLIGNALKSKIEKEQEWIIYQWKNVNFLSMSLQNQWAQAITKLLDWELVFYESNILTVTNTPLGIDSETLSLLINTILSGEETIPPVKVVAV